MLQRRLVRWHSDTQPDPLIEPSNVFDQIRWLGKNRDRNVSRKWHYYD